MHNGYICIWNEVSQVADLFASSMGYAHAQAMIIQIMIIIFIGIPVLIVAIAAGIRYDQYGTDN